MEHREGDGLTAREKHRGRLELTWTDKDLTLLTNEDGSYEWVAPSDYRVAEVRLLHDTGPVGETHGVRARAKDNLLVRGDALHALRSLSEIPEFAAEFIGKVKLVYLDPPFNTEQAFEHYDDNLEHSVWLTMMRDRLEQIRSLLAPDGSVWVHLDDAEMAYCKALMDEVFGRSSFVASVVWQKRTSRDNRAAFSKMHDYLLVYSPMGTDWKLSRNRLPDGGDDYGNPDGDPQGPWRSIPMSAQEGHATKEQFYEVTTPAGNKYNPPKGRAWTYTKPRFEELVAEGRVYWPKQGTSRPRLKMYPWEATGLVPFTVWLAAEVGTNDDAKKQILEAFPDHPAFDTPKPEPLLQRIIHIGSDPGDIVLDCFLGSGTSAAVAQKMGRRWVGIERSRETLERFCSPRLQRVVAGTDPGGVTEETEWEGGGGFRILDVGPSMFEDDEGRVVLAEWAANSALAEATAAQLGFEYQPESPFAGAKGRARLAVIDGLINADVIELLVSALGERERLVVCGTSVDPEAADVLRQARPGSRVRKIPASILAEYQETHRWRPRLAEPAIATSPPAGENGQSPTAATEAEGAVP